MTHLRGLQDADAQTTRASNEQSIEAIASDRPPVGVGAGSTTWKGGNDAPFNSHPSDLSNFRCGERAKILSNTQFVQESQGSGGKTFAAYLLARERMLFHQHDSHTRSGKQNGRGRAGGARADDEHVGVEGRIHFTMPRRVRGPRQNSG